MLKKHIIILFFISTHFLFSQNQDSTEPRPRLLLKVDLRSLELQPKLSMEYFFTKKLSLEAGACYFWTGQKMYEHDFYQSGILKTLLGIGPAKGNDIFSDVKYSFRNGTYVGMGYFYRYSHFLNKQSTADVGKDAYQYYNQSEIAYSNFLRLTVGAHWKMRNKNIYVNPYLSAMIGNTSLQLQIDTTGGKPANYSRDVLPINEKRVVTRCILIIGFNFCFDFFPNTNDLTK